MTDHKWKDVIVAWANGSKIQYRRHEGDDWNIAINPTFSTVGYFRVKPEPELIDGRWYRIETQYGTWIAQYFLDEERFYIGGSENYADVVEVTKYTPVTVTEDV